jgi:hypothetical protein
MDGERNLISTPCQSPQSKVLVYDISIGCTETPFVPDSALPPDSALNNFYRWYFRYPQGNIDEMINFVNPSHVGE